jgi:hypothetical protein
MPPENTPPATPVNPVAEVAKAIDGLKSDLSNTYVTKEQAEKLDKTLNDLKHEIKELRNSGVGTGVKVYEKFQDDPQVGFTLPVQRRGARRFDAAKRRDEVPRQSPDRRERR